MTKSQIQDSEAVLTCLWELGAIFNEDNLQLMDDYRQRVRDLLARKKIKISGKRFSNALVDACLMLDLRPTKGTRRGHSRQAAARERTPSAPSREKTILRAIVKHELRSRGIDFKECRTNVTDPEVARLLPALNDQQVDLNVSRRELHELFGDLLFEMDEDEGKLGEKTIRDTMRCTEKDKQQVNLLFRKLGVRFDEDVAYEKIDKQIPTVKAALDAKGLEISDRNLRRAMYAAIIEPDNVHEP